MQKLRPLEVLDVFQSRNERIQIVAIDGANVVETKLLKHGGRHHHAFGMLFKALGQLKQRRRTFQHVLAHVLGGGVKTATHELRQVTVQSTHWRADRHVVVIQDDQQFAIFNARIVHGFKGHARRHGAIAYDSNGVTRFALLAGRNGHAQGCRNAGGRMCRTECVVFTFVAPGKT